jgi:hypothetical protein
MKIKHNLPDLGETTKTNLRRKFIAISTPNQKIKEISNKQPDGAPQTLSKNKNKKITKAVDEKKL